MEKDWFNFITKIIVTIRAKNMLIINNYCHLYDNLNVCFKIEGLNIIRSYLPFISTHTES